MYNFANKVVDWRANKRFCRQHNHCRLKPIFAKKIKLLCFGIVRPSGFHRARLCVSISQLPKLCVKISILRHRRMWVLSFSTRLTSVTFAEDKVLIILILRKNAKIVQL